MNGPSDGFEDLDSIPESSKTLLVITVLEDLSDSQLVISVDERGVAPRHYLAVLSILTSMTSMLSARYAGETLRAQKEITDQVGELYARLGVENPFKSGVSLDDPDVTKTLDEISRYLDEGPED